MIPLGVLAGSRHVPAGGGGTLSVAFTGPTEDTANASTYTFTDMPIGAADASRQVVVAVSLRSTSPIVVTAVTIAGITATIDAIQEGPDNNARTATLIARAPVPTGTTATTVVTMTSAGVRSLAAAYALTGATPVVVGTATHDQPIADLALSPAAGPVVIFASSVGSQFPLAIGQVSTDSNAYSSEGNLRLVVGSSTAGPAVVSVNSQNNPQSVAVAYEGM